MPELFDLTEFQKSITYELNYTKNRVRNIIGDAHWGEEGRYKEAILKKVIKQFLPKNLEIGTGFIASRYDDRGYNRDNISNQLDLIVYDNTLPVIFREGDFVVLTETSVRGIIEVKTTLNNTTLKEAIEKFENLRKFHFLIPHKIFTGIFAYDFLDANVNVPVSEALKQSKGLINHISIGKDIFIRYWKHDSKLVNEVKCKNSFYNVYGLNDLSYSYFISNLLHITANNDLHDRHWFSFPIEGTKEIHRKQTICCN